MSNNLFTAIFATALSLASATFATPQILKYAIRHCANAQAEEGRTRYWSHPRLGMVKADAAGRMSSTRLAANDTARPVPSGQPSTRTH